MREWIKKTLRPPREEDCDELGCILAWHRYQGVLVSGIQGCMTNSYITHWMPMPGKPQDE